MSDEQLRRAIEDRDHLQARIDAYEGRLEEWEEIDRLIAASSLGGEEAQRVRDSVPPQVSKALVVAIRERARAEELEHERDDLREGMSAVFVALVGALQHDASSDIVESVRRLTDERDRLRAVVDAAQRAGADRIDLMNAEFGCPDCGVHHACGEIVAERDRLRAVVDAVREAHARLGTGDDPDEDAAFDAMWEDALRALVALDVSPILGVAPPPDAPRALNLVADVLHDAFKGATDVDLDLLAADVIDALQGRALSVELRWYDGVPGAMDEGVVVLGRHDGEPIERCPHCGAGPEGGPDCPLCRALDPSPTTGGDS